MNAHEVAAELAPLLAGTRFAGRTRVVEIVGSTIDEAKALAEAGAREGSVIVALEQERGRGQHGRTWFSPDAGGALTLSALLRPRIAPEQASVLTALSGLAAMAAARELGVADVVLKRPNDLVVGTADGRWRKLAGVLVDTAVQGPELKHAIVSLGLNLTLREADFPPPLRGLATSIELEVGRAPAVAVAASAFLRALELECASLEQQGASAWIAATNERYAAVSRGIPELTLPLLAGETP